MTDQDQPGSPPPPDAKTRALAALAELTKATGASMVAVVNNHRPDTTQSFAALGAAVDSSLKGLSPIRLLAWPKRTVGGNRRIGGDDEAGDEAADQTAD